MMGTTHAQAGVAGWLTTCVLVELSGSPLPPLIIAGGAAVAGFAALIPDIDVHGSDASRMLGPVTELISWVISRSGKYLSRWLNPDLPDKMIGDGHRQFTHSFLGIALWTALAALVMLPLHQPVWVWGAMAEGYANHVAMDMWTIFGCRLFWPDQHRWGWLPMPFRVRTGGRRGICHRPQHQVLRSYGRRRRRRIPILWRSRAGAEFSLVQPLVLAVALGAAYLLAKGK
jgi:membrane-bound metal-dependent hydrolase YbcI (DUF457 family)